jgi:hypothetical protein
MIKNFLKKKIYKIGFNSPLSINNKFSIINKNTKKKLLKIKFGNKNPKKKFYVIKRSPGGGFFSNLLYILIHLEFAEKKFFIPVVDMQNFPTVYNQKINMYKIKNLWNLYFRNVSNYSLNEVYKSKNVYFSTSNKIFFLEDYKKKNLKKIFDKYILPNNHILKKIEIFINKNFKKKKILGVHLRGTDQKISARHAMPPTIYSMIDTINKKIKKDNYQKIFLVTEELNYYKKLKKLYGKKICAYNVFRADKTADFSTFKRSNHKNLLGIENLIEAITLARCREIVYCETNISLFSIFYSNFKINKCHLNNGFKSNYIYISIFEWYLFKLLPDFMKFVIKSFIQKFRFAKN